MAMSSVPMQEVSVKSILLAYDFSDASRKPLHHATVIARHFQAKLHVVYVVSSLGYAIAGPEAAQLASEGSSRDAHRLEAELFRTGALEGLHYEFQRLGTTRTAYSAKAD